MKTIFWVILFCLSLGACNNESQDSLANQKAPIKEQENKEHRIISLNGTLTELIYALGAGNQLVGVDRTSTYPLAATELSNLGHASQLNAEAILALQPTMILIDEKNEGNEVLEIVAQAGVAVKTVTIPYKLEGTLQVAQQLSTILGQNFETEKMATMINRNQIKLKEFLTNKEERPKVLFIYARGANMTMVAGKNTFAESMIELAGGTHIIEDFESFKPLTPESLLQYQPDVILMFDKGLKSLANVDENKSAIDGLLSIKGILETPAGKNKRVITMNGAYLSGFGPRASEAALELAQKIHNN